MNIDETRLTAPPATRRKATVPTHQQSPPPPLEGAKSPSEEKTVEIPGALQFRNGIRRRPSGSHGENGTVCGQE